MKKLSLGIIGFGNMGGAIGRALNPSDFKRIFAYDIDRNKVKNLKNIARAKDHKFIIDNCDVILLAIKPQSLFDFIKKNKAGLVAKNPLIVSILAGTPISSFRKHLGKARVVRAMPNLAVLVGQAFTFLCAGRRVSKKDILTAKRIFSKVGKVTITEEKNMDRITSISGSGPGYVFYFMDAVYRSALKLGFANFEAREMVTRIFLGSARLAEVSGKDFSLLVKEVASRKGTTEAALKIFKSQKLEAIVNKGIISANRRSREISKKLKG